MAGCCWVWVGDIRWRDQRETISYKFLSAVWHQNVLIVHICQFPPENKTEINVKCLNVSKTSFVTINQQWSQSGPETISYGLCCVLWNIQAKNCLQDHFHVFVCWDHFLKKVNVSYFDSHRIIRIKFSPTAIKEAVKSSDNGTWYLILRVLVRYPVLSFTQFLTVNYYFEVNLHCWPP